MSANTVKKTARVDRRHFLAGAGGLLLAFTLDLSGRPAQAAGGGQVNAWINVGADESITIYIGGGEMGQGIYSGLAQIAAEELKVDWNKVRTAPAPAGQSWITGGSSGIRSRFKTLQVAGAAAREMLVAAAAQTWGVSVSRCTVAHGTVTNTLTGAKLTYGALAAKAATLPVPTNPPLTPPSQYQVIGQRVQRPDLPAKTDGSAQFGIDAVVPGMVFAAIKHCPTVGGTLRSTPATPAGALAVVPLDNAVAVVATNTWQAIQAARNLSVSWNLPPTASAIDSVTFAAQAQQLLANGPVVPTLAVGDVAGAFANAAQVFAQTYSVPYLAHSCMEVLNCTARVTATTCEVWAPTQAPGLVQSAAAAVTGLPASQVTVYPLLMGGGLGRKFELDYVIQAVRVAKAIGKPVKLTWPREEDMAHDQYRPMAMVAVRAALDRNGNIAGWQCRTATPSIYAQRGWLPPSGIDGAAVEGLEAHSYTFGSRLIEFARHPSPVPVGFWRSVGNSINAFVVESAIDEIAAALKIDPLAYRQRLLAGDPRRLAVLNAAAALGNWGAPLPAGRARGIAFADSFGTLVAQVAEVSAPVAGSLTVHSVACAVDCGAAINPDSVEAQMQGAVHHGLSAALWGEVKFTAGKASARNFSNYRTLLMRESPRIAVQIVASGAPLGGIGEPGVPPIAPAVANAYARLTGQRVRNLPFFPGARMSEG